MSDPVRGLHVDPAVVLNALGEATPDLVYVMARDGRYTFANAPAAAVLGLEPQQMIGRTWTEIGLPPDREREFVVERERVMDTGVPAKREVTFPVPGGERTFEYVVSPLYDAQRVAQGVVFVSRDITARTLAERELRRQLGFRTAIERSLQPGLVTLALDGRITWASPSFISMFGWSLDELLTFTPPYPLWPEEEIPKIVPQFQEVMATAVTPPPMEFLFQRKDGQRIPISIQPSPLFDERGEVMGWLAIVTDISEQRRRGEVLERQNFLLRTLLDVSEILTAEHDVERLLQAITDAATMLAGAEYGAFFYNVVDAQGEGYMLWTISGARRESFAGMGMPRNTEIFGPTFNGEGIVRSDDIRQDPRYGKNAPHFGLPKGHLPVVSYLAVPVISRTGHVIGGLFFAHSQPARFPDDVERLVAGVAAQAAIAIDNARLLEDARGAAERVRLEEERYRTLVTATSQIVWSTDAEGRPLPGQGGWASVTGQTPEEIAGDGWIAAVHPHDRERALETWRTAVETETPYEPEFRIRTAAGAYRWYLVRGVPVRNADGSIREWIGTATDVDDRKRSDEEASFLAEASVLLTTSLDPETILTRLAELAVPRLADWCAIDVAQENAPHKRLVIAHPDREKAKMIVEVDREYRLDPAVDPIAHVIRSGASQLHENLDPAFLESLAVDDRHREIIRSLGVTSWILTPIMVSGRVYGTLSLLQAESGRRFSERDLSFVEDLASRLGVAVDNALLYVEAQAANQAKDEFLATLSHELRTPMTSIVGWARLLEMTNFDAALVREGVQAIARSAQTQAQLIDDLLDVSRITLGKLHLSMEDVDVDEVVVGAVDAVRTTANVKGVVIDLHLDPARPHVSGDPNRLRQVLWNLVSNAVKFTPTGGRVDVTVERAANVVRVRVTDTGEGVAPEVLPYIFERFRQADSTTTRRHGGLGLGLSIAKQLVELHGGTIGAASGGPGTGATFTVDLPLARATTTAGAAVQTDADFARLDDLDLVVVDDDPQARRFVAAVLERAGARVRDAASAAEALALVRASIPSVLITDIAMPDVDGFELLQQVRKELGIAPSQMPAIAITAFGATNDRVRILSAGFQRYILKPVEPLELAKAVLDVASTRQT